MKVQVATTEEPFDAAREKFEDIVEQLCSPEALEMDHSELETLISTEGMEVLRRLLQGHLDFRGEGRRRGCGSDRHRRRGTDAPPLWQSPSDERVRTGERHPDEIRCA